MIVAKITQQLASELAGSEFQNGWFYNPIQDIDNNWIISLVEAQYLELGSFELIEFDGQMT
jgi:hypothetical protein